MTTTVITPSDIQANRLPTMPQSTSNVNDSALGRVSEIIDIEKKGLSAIQNQLTDDVDIALDLMASCEGRVVVTGMGKSGLIGKKIAATLSSTGTPAIFLHPAEGSHGDLGTVTRSDVVLAISNSGETPEILAVLPLIKRFGLPLISMTGKPQSALAKASTAVLNIAVPEEACSLGLAPTTSTTATLAMGDALAVVLLERKGFTSDDFAMFHPAGSLGKRLLLKVEDVMASGSDVPQVTENTPFIDVLGEINAKTLGMTTVVDGFGRLIGVVTDGDIRRALTSQPNTIAITMADLMGRQPKTITSNALAVEALAMMEAHKITSLIVVEDDLPVGVIHFHALIREGIA